jgi:hypothetical protein
MGGGEFRRVMRLLIKERRYVLEGELRLHRRRNAYMTKHFWEPEFQRQFALLDQIERLLEEMNGHRADGGAGAKEPVRDDAGDAGGSVG